MNAENHRTEGVIYRLNDRDEIVFVNREWDRFAIENCGEEIVSTKVLHRSLWEFVADSTTRLIYRQMLRRARQDRTIRFHMRCDSPEYRRSLEMTIVGREHGGVEFRTRTLAEHGRSFVTLLDSKSTRTGELLRVCSWCEKVFFEGGWIEVEEAVALLRLMESPALPALTHGICEECYRTMSEVI